MQHHLDSKKIYYLITESSQTYIWITPPIMNLFKSPLSTILLLLKIHTYIHTYIPVITNVNTKSLLKINVIMGKFLNPFDKS